MDLDTLFHMSYDEYVESLLEKYGRLKTWIPETHNYGISLIVRPPVTQAKA